MSPRYMGGFGVIAKSMARIHETVSFHSILFFYQRRFARSNGDFLFGCEGIELEETGCLAFILRG
jgi:hypothetical protein